MSNVTLITFSLSHGGAQRVMSLLANAWASRGHNVTLVTLESAERDCYVLDERVRRTALAIAGASGTPLQAVRNNRRRVAALRRALVAARSDVVLSFGDDTCVLTVLASMGTGIRCVLSERTDPAQHPIGRAWSALRWTTYRLADALVVQTHQLLPWARSLTSKTKTHVIPNPVRDMKHYAPGPAAAREPIVVAAGRLAVEKGFDVLIAAFREIAEEFPHWNLTILGEGEERASLLELIGASGLSRRVALEGWVAEPGVTFQRASLFVMPSRYEGFPNALLEAMACGLPVISTTCVGPREIITPEVDGVLVPVDDKSALASAMRRLMGNGGLRQSLAREAITVAERFDVERIIAQWDAVLGIATETGGRLTLPAAVPQTRQP